MRDLRSNMDTRSTESHLLQTISFFSLNLNLFAKFLKEEVGLINAINLDGGGSGTMVVNGSTVSYPGDSW